MRLVQVYLQQLAFPAHSSHNITESRTNRRFFFSLLLVPPSTKTPHFTSKLSYVAWNWAHIETRYILANDVNSKWGLHFILRQKLENVYWCGNSTRLDTTCPIWYLPCCPIAKDSILLCRFLSSYRIHMKWVSINHELPAAEQYDLLGLWWYRTTCRIQGMRVTEWVPSSEVSASTMTWEFCTHSSEGCSFNL